MSCRSQAPGERPHAAVPLVSWSGGKLSMRYNRCYLESAQRFPDIPRLEPTDVELFDLVDALTGSPELRLEVDFEVGDLLFLNNHAVLHSRTEYEDFTEPELKRHVLRLWLAVRQGRDLPPDSWGNPHSTGGGPGRGGVAPHDVIATQNSVGVGGCRTNGDRRQPRTKRKPNEQPRHAPDRIRPGRRRPRRRSPG
ncbi:TauD/TfdA family dioxygenase [Streptomyces sp. NPDC088846]|uniref:TauD/TfdA family dioxygenase n=1 Tax=unclassified Streptomyces TaxID=2593676 RepID=UPI003822C37D